jgi:hypothetical protein
LAKEQETPQLWLTRVPQPESNDRKSAAQRRAPSLLVRKRITLLSSYAIPVPFSSFAR